MWNGGCWICRINLYEDNGVITGQLYANSSMHLRKKIGVS
jgi:hypothetical protein